MSHLGWVLDLSDTGDFLEASRENLDVIKLASPEKQCWTVFSSEERWFLTWNSMSRETAMLNVGKRGDFQSLEFTFPSSGLSW